MVTLNRLGETFGRLEGVKAMTDVTGFGLLGHLREMCEGGGLSAVIDFEKVPVIASLSGYISAGCLPGGTQRNWASYGREIGPLSDEQKNILADPQTSGGLLVAVAEEGAPAFELLLRQSGLPEACCHSFGWLREPGTGPMIEIE